jgi:Protein of unknown function (DUF3667)
MATETPHPTDAVDEHQERELRVVGLGDGVRRGPFTLASLLELNDDELAEPISRDAPPEHRWEQLSFGVTPESGEAIPGELITGAATQPPAGEHDLIPGLDEPGAIEVPVYLAGRSLSDFLRQTAAATDDAAVASTLDDEIEATFAEVDALEPAVVDVDAVATIESAPVSIATPSPVRPPAIKAAVVGPPRKKQPAPAANFAKTTEGPVLWPKRKIDATPSVLRQECAKCGAPSNGDACTRCGHATAVNAPLAHPWNHFIAAFLDSDSRLLRTVGALILAPGELTRMHLAGHRRRYFPPMAVVTAALILFAIVSALGGLRPRPDRTLMIGTDRTAEVVPGLAHPRPVNLAIDSPPDVINDVASTMDYIPLLWFPLMAFGVVAVVAAVRSFQRSDEQVEVVFSAHFASWFVVWWGIAVPLLLLVLKFGFEYSAAWDGVGRVRYVDGGQIDGLSPTWNALRDAVASPAFHTLLVGFGLAPWAIVAWHRAFHSSWLRAGIAGTLVTAVPLLLLLPFA